MQDANRRRARDFAREHADEQLDLLRELARIPAPTHHEELRERYIRDWLVERGARRVEIGRSGDVLCRLGPEGDGLTVFSAHTDIVFDDLDELPEHEEDGRLYAPGVGDDTANLVNLLMATAWLIEHEEELRSPVLIVANTCEEGLGNLAGTKALYGRYEGRIARHVALDLYLGQLIASAVGSHRYRIVVETQGGHSYADFGRPNAIAELCSLVGDLYAKPVPDGAPVTFNVGRIEGGTTVNSIAARAEALYEYRSTSERSLALMRKRFRAIVASHHRAGVDVRVETIGIRPGNGDVDETALRELAGAAEDAIRTMSGADVDRTPASTDANVPLSRGIPAVCIGTVTGGLLHTRDEWVDEASMQAGLGVTLGLMLELCAGDAA